MLFGLIKGAAAAAADFAKDVKTCMKWIRFGSGRTSSSNGGNSLSNILDYREEFPSLEPIFRVIDRFRLKSLMSTPPEAWIHGNGSVTSPASQTHTGSTGIDGIKSKNLSKRHLVSRQSEFELLSPSRHQLAYTRVGSRKLDTPTKVKKCYVCSRTKNFHSP